ncbi:PDZ domain-containing protein [Massilia sp. PAMC28688]|uniref:S41 family peptidase n=1 Tax=Massilia sp. PAMC28688 TaxID=2861283 RepID=UPI001C62FE9C|nr:S41 family peptidase [Massilia sp. PAMC28688]QYF93448.1 PDZ domain-containing protein [Massilia sp. PAMC28688]
MTRFAALPSLPAMALLGAGLLSGAAHAAAPAYARFPAIRGDLVVFTAEGDLWKAGVGGGMAQRLTTHAAAETHAALSHDGKWIAFVASYEGEQEAYLMPVAGGLPRRLTFEGGGVTVVGWTRSGDVLISAQNPRGTRADRMIAAIDPATLARRVFPVADASDAVLDDSGKTLYFTRMGLALTGDNVKLYRGGAHAQLWRFDLDAKSEAAPVFAGNPANNRRPMWWQGRLYFISDRDGADKLWSARPDGSDARVHTSNREWDVRHAALGDGKIAYQLGADIHLLDLATGASAALPLSLLSDFDQQRKRLVRAPLENLTNVQLAGRTERVVITARGGVSIAGTGSQRRVEVAIPDGARARNATFSHDEKSVFAIVDASGENEIWRFAADGSGPGEQLTSDGASHRVRLFPSPDGRHIAHTDKRGRTWLLDLATKANSVIDDAAKAGVDAPDQVLWSPDSKHLAFLRVGSQEGRAQIGMYSMQARQLVFVTSDRYVAASPAFSPDGRWLYFLSPRHFNLSNGGPWGDRNMGPMFDRRNGIYALALQPGNRFPFKPDDELSAPAPDPAAAGEQPPAPTKPITQSAPVKPQLPAIAYPGLPYRLYEVPLAAGNYRHLQVDDKRLYFLEADGADGKATLKTLAIARTRPEPELFVAGVRQFALSDDRKRIFYRTFSANGPGEMMIVDAGAKLPADTSRAKVQVDDWSVTVSPRLEWRQMYNDAWRMHRDFLYDANMRGLDWPKVRAKYAPLVERVTDRAELNDILGMMVSEVGALHSQVAPGDIRKSAPEGAPASLGAVFARVADGYRIAHIYQSEPELPSERGPLSHPDIDIKEGDIITAVNGKSAAAARDMADLLLNTAGKQVLLQVRTAGGAGRSVIVTPVPMAQHAALRYADWEQSRARAVEQASKGRIGYLHLRAMGGRDIAAFAREFYANVQREGLIIDVRRNTGGNIDSWIVEKLLRKSWAFWASNGSLPASNMQGTFRGHLVVLTDELTYSDGETFAAAVKALRLGPVVGKRTAGAGVWLSDQNQLADNGMARVAEFGQFAEDGQWLIEGIGVTPDVEVDNLPHATFKGQDRQLEVALALLEKKMKEQPYKPYKPNQIPALNN